MADCSFNSHPFNSSGAFVLSAVAIVAVPAAVAATAAAGVVVAVVVVVVVGQAPPVRRPELSFFRLRVGKKCSVLQRCSIVLEIFLKPWVFACFCSCFNLAPQSPKITGIYSTRL